MGELVLVISMHVAGASSGAKQQGASSGAKQQRSRSVGTFFLSIHLFQFS